MEAGHPVVVLVVFVLIVSFVVILMLAMSAVVCEVLRIRMMAVV